MLDFADLDADGQIEGNELTARYLWGPETDQLLAVEQPDSLTTADPADVLWTLTDNLGSVRDAVTYDTATDTTTVAEHYAYDAFGNITAITDGGGSPLSAASLRHLYTAQEWDADIGLHYYDNRWYDSASGLFLSADPVEDDQNNTYRYVGNSPTNATDPTGLERKWNVDDVRRIIMLLDEDVYGYLFRIHRHTKIERPGTGVREVFGIEYRWSHTNDTFAWERDDKEKRPRPTFRFPDRYTSFEAAMWIVNTARSRGNELGQHL